VDWELIFETTIRAAFTKDAIVYALAGIGLNVHFGYTGLLNFGQAAFVALGAYGVAVTVETFDQSFYLGLVVSVVAAAVFALLLGVPTLRLRADYLAIVTIAAAESLRLILRSVTFTPTFGGSSGINNFTDTFYDLNPYDPGRYGFGPLRFRHTEIWPMTVGWILVGLAAVFVYLLMRSPWGRVLKSIREDEDAGRSLGKNVFSYKMQSLVIGGVIGAFAGIVNALATRSVQPDNFGTPLTFFILTALLLGGAARVIGPIIGSMLFWMVLVFTDVFLRQASANDLIPSSIMTGTQIGAVRFMLVGLMLALLIIFRPQGILGDRREIELDAR
jgi:branched-chain amino acid transport system permease protein